MIINVRGTGGSGKSTIVRKIMDEYDEYIPVMLKGRRQPLYYELTRGRKKRLIVLGHYETVCGGCDTINDQADIYRMIRALHGPRVDILYEGLLVSGESARAMALAQDGFPFLTIVLTTPVETCIQRIYRRRAKSERNYKPLKEENTVAKYHNCLAAAKRIEAHGGKIEYLSCRKTVQRIKELLKL